MNNMAPGIKSDNPSSFPGPTSGKERTDSHKLSSDLNTILCNVGIHGDIQTNKQTNKQVNSKKNFSKSKHIICMALDKPRDLIV